MTDRRKNRLTGDERGATLALVAVSMVLLLVLAALAVDLAAAYAWRVEAQKIADSSALAGGSAYLDVPDDAVPTPATVAENRAYEYALLHTIKKEPVQASEVTVQIVNDERLVRVEVRRENMPTWFARVIGIDGVTISAVAAAKADDAGTARCLKPIAVPDMWEDADDDTDGDNVWEEGEDWEFDEGDSYERWNGPGTNDLSATGYGSDWRSDLPGDYGREIQIKSADPQNEFNFEPGIFFPWRIPDDPNQAECDQGGGGGNTPGGAAYRQNLCECNNSPVSLFTPYDLEPGNMIGPTQQGVGELIDEDPDAEWSDALGGPARPDENGELVPIGVNSPRVIKVALFDPRQITSSGMQSIEFNNFALMFLEEQGSGQNPVIARFMYYAGGTGDGSTGPGGGSLVRYLRLVE
ncbi:MAG: pilus assembly protein TadG-related protein [Gemmatimonadota bacterium]